MEITVSIHVMPKSPINLDVETIEKRTNKFKEAYSYVYSIIANNRGHIYGMMNHHIIAKIPVDNADCLKEIIETLAKDLRLRDTTIGVGETPKQAEKAVEWALQNAKNSIKVYVPSETDAENLPENEDIKKAENDLSGTEEETNKIAQTVELIKKNKIFFEALKQASPNVYNSIALAMQALARLIAEKKDGHIQQGSKLADKIKSALEKHHEKELKRVAKDLQRVLDKEHSKHTEEDKAKSTKLIKEKLKQKRQEEMGRHKQLLEKYPLLAAVIKGKE